MRYLLRHPVSRALAISFILFAQFQLLWVTALHQHEPLVISQRSAVRPGSPLQGSPPADSSVFCIACQIVRQNAARPSSHPSVLRPVVFVERYPDISFASFHSYDLTVQYGRAPPLS